jgi:hypothetical protein
MSEKALSRVLVFMIILFICLVGFIFPRFNQGKSLIWANDNDIKQALADPVVIKLVRQVGISNSCGVILDNHLEDICDALALRLKNINLFSPWFLTGQDVVYKYQELQESQRVELQDKYIKCLASGKDNC